MKNIAQSALVNILLFSIFWAIEIFIAKLAFNAGAQVIAFTLQSSFLTLIILSIYILPTKLKELKKIPFHTIKRLFFANAIHMGLGGFLGNAGIQLTTAINAGFLSQFTLVSGTIFAWLILKEKMTMAKIISVFTIIVGTFLLITKGQLIIPYIGDLFLILACICWGLGLVLVRKTLKNTSINSDFVSLIRPVAGIPIIILFIFLSPMYPSSLQKIFQVNIFDLHQTLYVILSGIIVSFVWIFANRTLKLASASYTSMMSSITPILVALLATIFLNERIEGIQFIGILLIISSSLVTHYLKIDRD